MNTAVVDPTISAKLIVIFGANSKFIAQVAKDNITFSNEVTVYAVNPSAEELQELGLIDAKAGIYDVVVKDNALDFTFRAIAARAAKPTKDGDAKPAARQSPGFGYEAKSTR